jgi:iron complex outermembrane recepter protein
MQRRTHSTGGWRLPALSVIAVAIAAPAWADTTDAGIGPAIIVSARKTNEKVGEIPATITAISVAQLNAAGPVTGTGDLLRTVPGVRFNDLASPNLGEIAIRGSGSERATGADSGVGLFVNGAYVGSSTLGGRNFRNIDMFDLDRVEVLEGPQSALYGRNAEYGVVNLVSARPAFNRSGYIDETFTGSLDQNRLTGVVNQKLSDDWAVRIGGQWVEQSGGFYRNPDNGQHYDHTSGWLARGQVRYRHGPLDVDLSVDGQDMKLPTFATDYALPAGVLATIPLGYTSDRFNVPGSGINATRQRVERTQLLATLDLGWATLSSTSMGSHFVSDQFYGSPIDLNLEGQFQSQGEVGVYPLTQVHTHVRDRTFYQDLHLGGKAAGSRLEWLAGGEVLNQHDFYQLATTTSPCTLTAKSGICGGTPSAHQCYELTPASLPCPATYPAAFGSVATTPQRYTSAALYGSLRFTLGKVTLSGEGRYTYDWKNATQSTAALYTGTATGTPNSYEFKAGRASYAATVSYKLPGSRDDLVYGKIGTGYRAGGVNSGTSTTVAPIPFLPTYRDEETVSYEAGFKGNIGRHVFVTLDAYASHTDNAIASITDGCTVLNVCKQAATTFNINGGTVHAKGVELAVNGHFTLAGGPLNLSANAADQRARYVAVSGTYAGLPVLGSPVAQTPWWTQSASLDYRHALVRDVTGFLHVTYNGQSGGGQDTVTGAAPLIAMPAITNVSLRTGLDYRKVELALFVQNLTDQSIRLLTFQSGGITYAYRSNQPRTFGVNGVVHW